MYGTLSEAIAAAKSRQQAAQCAAGRHVADCPHRATLAPWARRAMDRTLPTKEYAR